MSWSDVETGRSPPGSEGRFRSVPSKASVEEPPPSNADAVTAPSRTSVCASSKFVIPTLYPARRPSATTMTMRPSASWPTAVRGWRGASWLEVNASCARKTGLPSRTRTGPPPTACAIPVHSGRKMSRSVKLVPTGDSSTRRWAAVPRATSTAPPGGIGVPPPPRISVTGPTRSAFGVVGGSGRITTSAVPGWTGVATP